jgi:glycosyltransferase involved in cell wall biosynthesis
MSKVAIVHDWLVTFRGGERVLEAICELYPAADIYTLVHKPVDMSHSIESHRIFTSFLQNIPNIGKTYRMFLPIMPFAIESLDFKQYDLVISSSYCVAKGAISRKGSVHICYCHTPMRYVWDMYDEYFGKRQGNALIRTAMSFIRPYLQKWDRKSSARVDHFIANSEYVSKRIKRCYDRESTVIYPPVDINRFNLTRNPKDFYLIVSAFAPYKRIDLAIETFNILGFPLKIIGSGQDEKRLRGMAKDNIEFLGGQSDEVIKEYYSECKAFIFPGEEDFGITPVEAQASGCPVIAYGRGGVLETVIEDKTGIFFYEQTIDSLIEAVRKFEKDSDIFDPQTLRRNAERFNKERFRLELKRFVEERYE